MFVKLTLMANIFINQIQKLDVI
ncbi:Protein of unknown function [Leuconostoc citreum]|nr:Protein of unknown function [Leuconostoc citreum]